MKRTRILAVMLAVCLCAALVVPAAAAEADVPDFTDVEGHWALPYIQEMTAQKIFTGYGDGTFRPELNMQRIEGFALCARVTQKVETRLQIAADQAELLDELFPDMGEDWWFRKEAATCMALGVATGETLAEMNNSGALNEYMTKAEFAKYLVRGMGLEELACTQGTGDLDFADETRIAGEFRPHVKLLRAYGVLTGDENNNFNPDQPLTRAVCATMLSRALEHIVEEQGISVELPQYTKYSWDSGMIVDVDPAAEGTRTLKLNSEITGEKSVTLSADTKVYQYNKQSTFTALKTGAFAKVCYAADGKTVEAVRVIPANRIEHLSGKCDGDITTDAVAIGGIQYPIDRFTQVSAGGKVGDRSVIDYDAHYTDAEAGAAVDGAILWLKLTGGTRQVEGILTDVTVTTVGLTERTTITVNSYGGVATTYVVPEGTAVTVNGAEAVLRESQEGRQVTLRVSDADLSEVKAVAVNMVDRYVQGVLREIDTKSTPTRVDIKGLGDGKGTTYDIADDCTVAFRGSATELDKLVLNSFVTAKVEGGTVTSISAWQGYEDTEGVLTDVTYGDPTVLKVTRADNTVVQFSIPLERMKSVAFTSGGKSCDITQLHTGDHVVVTMLYNDVTQVECTPQSANVTGTLSAVSYPDDGSVQLTILFDDGSRHTYTATASTTVTQGGKPVVLGDLASLRQSKVSLLAEGERALSVEITGTSSAKDTVSGAILTKDDSSRIVTILITENGQTIPKNVHIASGVPILDVTTGTTLRGLSNLKTGETIQAWGSYAANGNFEATSVVRK